MSTTNLGSLSRLMVRQVHEIGEWFGFETRNKYSIETEQGAPVAYAAEQQKGIFGFFLRQFLGHWRSFEVHFFTPDRRPFLIGRHPFRWYFERIEVLDVSGNRIGAIQKRFSILSKRFDVENESGRVVMQVASPIWRIWTFPFMSGSREVASIQKKWSGVFFEALTDKDRFLVEYKDQGLDENTRMVIMAAAIFVDLLYFERKAD